MTDGGAVDALFDAIPRELRDTLFPFQRDGVRFALARHGRALIGDEMACAPCSRCRCRHGRCRRCARRSHLL